MVFMLSQKVWREMLNFQIKLYEMAENPEKIRCWMIFGTKIGSK